MAQPPGGPPSNYQVDLDILTGSERRFKLGGRVIHMYAVFSSNDVAHWRKILDRSRREQMRSLTEAVAVELWEQAVREANAQGAPPPQPPDMEALRLNHPDLYLQAEYERDIYNLLLSVWSKSESSKPEHEREPVTAETVRDLTDRQTYRILDELFPLRNGQRVPPPEEEQRPESPQSEETADATSTASTTRARSQPAKAPGQRKRTSRSSVS